MKCSPASPDPSGPSIRPRWLLIVALVAIGYRLVCMAVLADHPLLRFPVIDAGYHDAWAKRILAGDLLGHGPDDVFKPPFYAYFLAGLYAFPGQGIAGVQWAQHALGVLSCLVTALIAARLLGRRAGLFAGLLGALYAPYVFFESQLLTPALGIALNLTAMLLVVEAIATPSKWRFFFAGVLLGLSAGVRPDVMLPSALSVVALVACFQNKALKAALGSVLVLAAGGALVLAPVTMRNYRLTGEIIPVSSNAGINFYSGNHSSADGVSAVPVGLRWERLVSRVPQEVLEKPSEASRWWVRQAAGEMARDPAAAAARMGRKLAAFFNGREFRNNICFHFMQQSAWPLGYPFVQYAVILPLAFCGLVMMARMRDRRSRVAFVLCLSWVLGYLLAGIAFFVNARFRLPAVPFLMIPAGCAISRTMNDLGAKNRRALGCTAVLFLTAGLVAWPMWLGDPARDWARDYVNLGNAYYLSQNLDGAESSFRKALEIEPDPDAHYLLGRLLLARHQTSKALQHLQAALRRMPDSPDLLLAGAKAHLAERNPQKARALLEHLIEVSRRSNLWPERASWASAHLLLAEIMPSESELNWQKAWAIDPVTTAEASFLRRANLPRVLETFRAESGRKPWDWYALANYGMILMETGRYAEALGPLTRASKLAPERFGLRFHLARAYCMAGNREAAKTILGDLLRVLPEGPLRNQAQALLSQLAPT